VEINFHGEDLFIIDPHLAGLCMQRYRHARVS